MSQENISEKLQRISSIYKKQLKASDLDPDSLYIKYLGKKGEINTLLKEIVKLDKDKKIKFAKEINLLKRAIAEDIENIRNKTANKISTQIDLTTPVKKTKTGHLHPLNYVLQQIYQFFHYYGFSVFDGPEIEDDYHNFEMLGVPKDHPARDLQDTLYIMEPDVLLRTQTSSIEARVLEQYNPPIRFVAGGKAFRNETINRTNSAVFYQFQGVYVDKNVTMGNLKWIFTKALKFILGENTKIRFRAKYYPEVEPGLSPDIQCTFCDGKGCEVCKNRGWIEIAGGGMIHPTTLEKAGIDPKEYSGFAFGWGLDRVVMARFGIDDIRTLMNGGIRYE